MKHSSCLILLLVILILTSCKKQYPPKFDDEEIWKLGWRLIESSMDKQLVLAESQFDSLLKLSENINEKFLAAGLEVKSKLNKHEEIGKLLEKQKQEILDDICHEEFLKGFGPCLDIKELKPKNPALQLELIKMYINDQYVRSNLMEDLMAKYNLNKSEVIIDSFGMNTDERNRNRLKEIFEEFEFPTREMVGKDAMNGIFIMIQHADGDKEWQKSQLKSIEQAVKNGDMDGQSFAYLYDRIKINNGENQLYGTQFSNVDFENKTVELAKTEDIENLDHRRREVGMMPIEMYKRIMLKNI